MSVVADTRRKGGVLFFYMFFLVCAQYLTTSVIFWARGRAILSTSKASSELGVLRAYWDLKTENGVFFGHKSFLTQISLFSLEFLKRHFCSLETLEEERSQEGELPRFVPNKPMCL